MFRLVRWICSLAVLFVMIWFATTVQLGKRTLFGHLRAIFATQAAKDLADGTAEEARKVAHRVRQELRADGGAAAGEHPPLDPVGERDRRNLDRLVREKAR